MPDCAVHSVPERRVNQILASHVMIVSLTGNRTAAVARSHCTGVPAFFPLNLVTSAQCQRKKVKISAWPHSDEWNKRDLARFLSVHGNGIGMKVRSPAFCIRLNVDHFTYAGGNDVPRAVVTRKGGRVQHCTSRASARARASQ
jgi:hypothetical protein